MTIKTLVNLLLFSSLIFSNNPLLAVENCPEFLLKRIKEDRNQNMDNLCRMAKMTKVFPDQSKKKVMQYMSPKDIEFIFQTSKVSQIGAPEGSLFAIPKCLGDSQEFSSDEKMAIVSEYTLLRNKIAFGAQSLMQELYDIEATLGPRAYDSETRRNWNQDYTNEEYNLIKRFNSNQSNIPGMASLIQKKNSCYFNQDIALTRYQIKTLRISQTKDALIQISVLNSGIEKIVKRRKVHFNFIVQATLDLENQLRAVREVILASYPWLKEKSFKSLIERENFHKTDVQGEALLDEKNNFIHGHFTEDDLQEITLAFEEQARDRHKVILEELAKLEHAAGCINGNETKDCSYKKVMKELGSTPNLSGPSNLMRVELLKEGIKDKLTLENLPIHHAINALDNVMCRQDQRGFQQQLNKLYINTGIDIVLTLATAGVGAYLNAAAKTAQAAAAVSTIATTETASAAALEAALSLNRASQMSQLAQILSVVKHPTLALSSLSTSTLLKGALLMLNNANTTRLLIQAIDECDTKIKIAFNENSLDEGFSCSNRGDAFLQVEHNACLGQVLAISARYLPNLAPALRNAVGQTKLGNELIKQSDEAFDALSENQKNISALSMEIAKRVSVRTSNIIVGEIKKKEAEKEKFIHGKGRNLHMLQFIKDEQIPQEKIKNAYLLKKADAELEGLSTEEKAFIEALAAQYKLE